MRSSSTSHLCLSEAEAPSAAAYVGCFEAPGNVCAGCAALCPITHQLPLPESWCLGTSRVPRLCRRRPPVIPAAGLGSLGSTPYEYAPRQPSAALGAQSVLMQKLRSLQAHWTHLSSQESKNSSAGSIPRDNGRLCHSSTCEDSPSPQGWSFPEFGMGCSSQAHQPLPVSDTHPSVPR